MQASPQEVRAARAFLYSKGMTAKQVSPRKFANSAKEMNVGFSELLAFIARMFAGGQNQSRFRQEAIMKEVSK